jgi:hypothetical protein
VDAIGGTLKSHARRLVLSRKAVISNAADFVNRCVSLNIKIFPYSQDNVDQLKLLFNAEWIAATIKPK